MDFLQLCAATAGFKLPTAKNKGENPNKPKQQPTSELRESTKRKRDSDDDAANDDTDVGSLFGDITARRVKKPRLAAPEPKPDTTSTSLRKKHKIYVKGTGVPSPIGEFKQLLAVEGFPKVVVDNLAELYTEPTAIQMQGMPSMLAGNELLACAPTGSGKTAAFIVPLLGLLGQHRRKGPRALILAPTRELSYQIHEEFHKLGKGLDLQCVWLQPKMFKNGAYVSNKKQLRNTDFIITSPKCLTRLIEAQSTKKNFDGSVGDKKLPSLKTIQHLVLDEADQLFDLGYREQLDEIITACSGPGRKLYLFSATLHPGVQLLLKNEMQQPVKITVGLRGATTLDVDQKLNFVGSERGKLDAFKGIVKKGVKPPVLVFVQSKERAQQLYRELKLEGINIKCLTSTTPPKQRLKYVKNFRLGKIWFLICTDMMCRGLDFPNCELVINYDFPQTTSSYIHRVGRTGRAGRKGSAVTFFTEADSPLIRSIAGVMKTSGCKVPEWMLGLKRMSRSRLKEFKKKPIKRKRIGYTLANVKKHPNRTKARVRQQKKYKAQREANRPQQSRGGDG